MHLLYLDDAGSAGNPNERYFVLGGIALFERQVHWLAKELDKIVKAIGWHPSETPDIELRASSILSGKKRWRHLRRHYRREILLNSLATIDRLHGNSVLFAAAIDKSAVSPEDPVEYAFEQLCNRFDRFLLRKHRQGDTQRGLMVLDNSAKETRMRSLAAEFKHAGHRWGTLANMADVPFFVDSKATRPIQYADLVAHAVWRHFEKDDSEFFNVIQNRFDSEGGVIHGLVHFKNPSADCCCPACTNRIIQQSP